MITVSIAINGVVIMARSAVNKEELVDGHCVYECDDGSQIHHRPLDGAIPLAKKMLNTIKEVK